MAYSLMQTVSQLCGVFADKSGSRANIWTKNLKPWLEQARAEEKAKRDVACGGVGWDRRHEAAVCAAGQMHLGHGRHPTKDAADHCCLNPEMEVWGLTRNWAAQSCLEGNQTGH